MTQKPPSKADRQKIDDLPMDAGSVTTPSEYKVGPGRPPKEFQFKPGQSGNPKGAKRKSPSITPNLRSALQRALDKKVRLNQGEREQTVSMAEAGIRQLVAQFARGDRYARRDLIALANQLGVDLTAGQADAVKEAIASDHQALLDAYVDRQYDKVMERESVLAPPELLDDDSDDQDGT
ncbi:hypothetical protein GGQ85_003537 [Nitrobacter vulgaris]|uniref:DUF5681 domain-containing protein n=1 Tax=Nitrobacter vulgaris TaxID=29421 RepID=UPI00286314D6|nr:DUF5681 domain-containing protein [Nitrobacter vulgaris]MDR6305812.1 hypothetical protein [Nitrobacter vulgaris]